MFAVENTERGVLRSLIPDCELCGEKIDPIAADNYHEEAGWTLQRKRGGTNALRLRSVTGRWAHWRCVHDRARGVSGEQETLW